MNTIPNLEDRIASIEQRATRLRDLVDAGLGARDQVERGAAELERALSDLEAACVAHGSQHDHPATSPEASTQRTTLSVDSEGRIVSTDESAAEMFGYACQELIGRPVEMLMPERFRERHARHRARYAQDLQHRDMGRDGMILRGLRKDGSEFALSVSLAPEHTPDGPLITAYVRNALEFSDADQSHAELVRERDQLRRITDALPVLVAYVGTDERYAFVNKRYQEWFDMPADCIVGHRIDEMLDASAYRRLQPYLKKAFAGQSATFENEVRHRDGSVRVVNTAYVPDRDAQGNVRGFIALNTDITERRRIEQEREEAEQRAMFRARLLDAVEQAAIATDMDGTITYWNSSAEHLYGWSADEVLGRNIAEITVPQIAAERAAEIMAQLVAGKTWAGEFVVQRKDGTTFTADVFDSPVRDADGATIGIIGVSNDVTQRKRAEDALRKSERDLAHSVDQLHAILDLVPVGIAIVDDPACTQLRLNPALARIFGVPAGTIASRTAPPSGTPRPFKLCRDGVEIPGDELPLQTAAATGRPATRQQIDVVRDDGSTIHIIADAVPLFDEQGAVRGAVSAVVDVTQAREIEAELRHANNVKDEFLSLVSHELKTPITIIAGNAEVLEKRAPYIDEESRTAALLDISNESERLSHIIDDLLVLSRLDRGYRFDREPLMVQRIVDRVVTWHRRDLPERKFIVRHGKGIPAALGSPPSVEQVLNNLLSNAEKYSPDDAPVEVSVRRAGDEVEVVVADRGIGILPDELEHLFAPFYRSPRVAAEAAGVGIGLAVCKRLVEAQSGRIWVRPREGGGSEFAFTLPVADGNH